LVLPNHDRLTVSRGHSLGPRFMTYADTSFDEICAVLKKMILADPPLWGSAWSKESVQLC
jgi:hypothetical protein